MAAIDILDKYYLAVTLLITIGYQLSGFAIAWTLQFDKITDFTGGSNFFILALFTLLTGRTFNARNIVASILVMVWASRLAGFLLFRVLKIGSDSRFNDIRSRFLSFLGFWVGQILWVWVVSLPLIILNSPATNDPALDPPKFGNGSDIAGIVLWAVGWSIESVADLQKYLYKSARPPRDVPMKTGLWAWSRHPPYFGEILCWWGVWLLCSASHLGTPGLPTDLRNALLGTLASPLLTMLILIFGSGIPTAEKPTARKYYLLSHGPEAHLEHSDAWKNYKSYLDRTSILVLIPPGCYRILPQFVKQWILLDLPLFLFDEKTDGPMAIEEERKKAGHNRV